MDHWIVYPVAHQRSPLLTSIQEAVDLRRDLVAEQPDELNAHLVLRKLSHCLLDIHGAVFPNEQV